MDNARLSAAQTPEQFGPYEVYERLGMGGMAQVHRAKKRGPAGFERTVALKRMLSHLTEDRNFVDSFVREAKVASLLAHPNIAQVYDFGRINGIFYIAMELVGGFDLRKLLRHAHKTNEAIPLPVVLSILAELCEALDYAHSFVDETGSHLNIVHRDISPSNMIVSPMGHVKVIDFGIAKANTRQLHTETGSVKGKLGYMAPEVALGMQVTPVADIFSAGVVAWELVTALPLFSARTDFETMRKLREESITPPSRYNPTCPALLDQVILAALAREPEDRLANARAFRSVIDQVAVQQGISISARAVADWMRDFGPPSEIRPATTSSGPVRMSSGHVLPLQPGPETRVTSASRPSVKSRPNAPQLRRSDDDIALATEIWGDEGTKPPDDDPGEDFSMAGDVGPPHRPSNYAQSLPGTPMGAQIPSLATSGRVQVIAPSQFGAVPTTVGAGPAMPEKKGKLALLVLAGLAVVAGILGGVLYAKKSDTSAGPANAQVHFVIEPAGATVEVAGNTLGTSPLDAELAPGVYSVVVRREGFKTWSTSLALREGDKQTINVALTSEPVAAADPDPAPAAATPERVTPPVLNDSAVSQNQDDSAISDKPADKTQDTKTERRHRPQHTSHGTTQKQPDKTPDVVTNEPDKQVDPPKEPVRPDEPVVVKEPVKDPIKTPPPQPDKPKTTPLVGPTAVTKVSGEIPTLRGKSGDSSDILAKACIDESGRVTSVTIKKSPPEISGDLQRALMTWRYKPYVNKDGKVSPVCFPVTARVILKQ
jgi:eukaryotic-like serine/threonine-protein kinase